MPQSSRARFFVWRPSVMLGRLWLLMKCGDFVLALALAFCLVSSPVRAADACGPWQPHASYDLDMRICRYDYSKSGYYQFRNRYHRAVRVNFTLNYSDGTSEDLSTPISADSVTSGASCWKCVNAGVASWRVRKLE